MKNFKKFITVLLGIIVSYLVNGFVLLKLWEWFIVTTFKVQPLNLVQAIGIVILINFLFIKKEKSPDNFWKEFKERVAFLIVTAVFILFIGWIVTLFM